MLVGTEEAAMQPSMQLSSKSLIQQLHSKSLNICVTNINETWTHKIEGSSGCMDLILKQ